MSKKEVRTRWVTGSIELHKDVSATKHEIATNLAAIFAQVAHYFREKAHDQEMDFPTTITVDQITLNLDMKLVVELGFPGPSAVAVKDDKGRVIFINVYGVDGAFVGGVPVYSVD